VQQGSPDRIEIQPLVGPDTGKQLFAADSSHLLLRLANSGDAQCSQQEGRVHLADHRAAAGEQVVKRAVERPQGDAVEPGCEQLAPDARRGSADLAWTKYPEDRPGLGQLVADTRGERCVAEHPAQIIARYALHSPLRVERPFGRDVRGAVGKFVEVFEPTRPE